MDKLNAFIGQFVSDLGASVHAGMVVIGIAGFLSDQFVQWLGRRLLRWSPQYA